ncbi:MAG TPA: PAS domain S-box protein, partial [Thermodesulfobacteriota bacterium]|nr:PAS domain S-box protein [Thermodesulfobacteriota bacterium]
RKRAEEALRESEERFRTLAENSAAGILIYQGEHWRYANPAALTITGYTHGELLKLRFWDVVHPDFRELVKSRGLARQRGEQVPSHYEFKIVTKGGQSRWVDFTGGMIVYQGKPAGVIMAFDVTDRKEAEEAFLLQQTYFRQLFENSPEGIVMLDNADRVLAVNRGFEQIFQFGKEDLAGSRLNDHIVPEEDREKATLISRAVLGGEVVRTEATRRRKDGRLVPVSILGFPILLQGDQIGVYGIYQDITARRESDERLDKLAHFDPLTDLPNRYRMREILKEALASGKKAGQRLAVLFLDLDRFKEINDTAGHDVADQVLQSAAHRLGSRVRHKDTVARMGSDEFLIVLPELRSAGEVEETFLQIRRAFSRPIRLGPQEFHLTLSAGAALFPEDGEDLDTLLKNADIALERAKAEGGDGFQFFTAEMSTLATERFRMKGRLRKALERQEFTLYYQPIVEGRGGRVLATEALLRWKSPEEGIIGPGRFIGVAEETG